MKKDMINFTVGPVSSSDEIRKIGSEQVPYFRTQEFSNLMFENEELMKKFLNAPKDSKTVFITGSGTASMEATIINTLTNCDKVLIINGGSFGHRFVEMCDIHGIPYDEIKLDLGKQITIEQLQKYDNKGYTAFLVNVHETSTGVHYDIDLISRFCQKNHLFLIVDAISSFLADELDMEKLKIDVIITGSQKALACPPGISIIVLSPNAIEKVYKNDPKCMYLNLANALKNGERGQTPFTPAVSILRQINYRLQEIEKNGGAESEINKVINLANYFRDKIKDYPFEMVTECPSNAITCLKVFKGNANEIFLELKDNYNIWICPNGGELKDKIFRVGHIGHLMKEDYDKLLDAFEDLKKRGIL